MPRRKVPKGKQGTSKPKQFKKSDGKQKRWNTVEDIPMDEEDQFHSSKDKILLEGDYFGGNNDDEDDEEVFALKGMEDDSEISEDGEVAYEQDVNAEEQDTQLERPSKKQKNAKESKKKGKSKQAFEGSDEENEEEEGWGRGRAAYYASNADEIGSDDEEANELEEQEATRLQSKLRSTLKDDDFGLNDNPEIESGDKGDVLDIPDTAPSNLPASNDREALLRHLEKNDPESLALARDWDDVTYTLQKTREKIAQIESKDAEQTSSGMVHLHYQALLTYSTTLAFYLYLRASQKYAQQPALLREHPIMQRLLTLKQSLITLEDLDFAAVDDGDFEDEDEDEDFADMWADEDAQLLFDPQQGLEPNELDDLLNDAGASVLEPNSTSTVREIARKPPNKKRKPSKDDSVANTPSSTVFDLVEPQFAPSDRKRSRTTYSLDTSDSFGEAMVLDEVDAADKSAHVKSLRFHTSKIESASARRQGARAQAAGGDDDIPYRDRKKAKDGLIRQAAKRANEGGADLDEVSEFKAGNKRRRGSDDEDGSGEDDYYQLVRKASDEKKEKKKAEYEENHGRIRVSVEGGESGPRSLTRAILTNKGLTPHRPKSVRNPRVKKRQKYEKAKQKLSSQKATFKGGLATTGRYDGEKSGISKVVKSVRLG